jgi:hypothetical protein
MIIYPLHQEGAQDIFAFLVISPPTEYVAQIAA